jgi:hypothetical protein
MVSEARMLVGHSEAEGVPYTGLVIRGPSGRDSYLSGVHGGRSVFVGLDFAPAWGPLGSERAEVEPQRSNTPPRRRPTIS